MAIIIEAVCEPKDMKIGNNLIPFFQTHPNPSERIENARQAAQ